MAVRCQLVTSRTSELRDDTSAEYKVPYYGTNCALMYRYTFDLSWLQLGNKKHCAFSIIITPLY